MKILINTLGAIILFLGLITLWAVCLAFPIMWLWNWLMPVLFGFKTITFFQALGLYMLCSVLFKSSTSSSKKD